MSRPGRWWGISIVLRIFSRREGVQDWVRVERVAWYDGQRSEPVRRDEYRL
ncbi:MAG TPA: hypothetical protein VNT01_12375 [Symbiobacteriaceae bacterium]|nr:hypothetical protein [Symbiobacteriaceae bacterium]